LQFTFLKMEEKSQVPHIFPWIAPIKSSHFTISHHITSHYSSNYIIYRVILQVNSIFIECQKIYVPIISMLFFKNNYVEIDLIWLHQLYISK
jgi:hypothetical protein